MRLYDQYKLNGGPLLTSRPQRAADFLNVSAPRCQGACCLEQGIIGVLNSFKVLDMRS